MAAIRYFGMLEVSAKKDAFGDVKIVVSNVYDMDRDFSIVVIEGAAFCRLSGSGFDDKDYVADRGTISDMIGTIIDVSPNQTVGGATDWVMAIIDAYKHS